MPNIEIHGFGSLYEMLTIEKSAVKMEALTKLQTAITEILMEAPFAEDAVITTCDTRCFYLDKKPAPFLRVCDTDVERAKEIACELMKELEIDIEIVHLAAFLPRPPFKLSPT